MQHLTALVTGASSGFGLLTTIELAKRDFSVIAAIRNMETTEKILSIARAHGVENKLRFLHLDVSDGESVNRFAAELPELPPIDILINNAGYALGGFCEEISLEEYKEQFETNFFGVIRVTQAILPFMRRRKTGKIINMSSISGKIGFPGLSPYVSSKHALEGWSECLRLEVKPFGIDVILIEPGSFKTSIWTKGKRIAKRSSLDCSPYRSYMRAIEGALEKGERNHEDPQAVASLIADICISKEVNKLRIPIGKGVKASLALKNNIPWKAWENFVMKRLLK